MYIQFNQKIWKITITSMKRMHSFWNTMFFLVNKTFFYLSNGKNYCFIMDTVFLYCPINNDSSVDSYRKICQKKIHLFVFLQGAFYDFSLFLRLHRCFISFLCSISKNRWSNSNNCATHFNLKKNEIFHMKEKRMNMIV